MANTWDGLDFPWRSTARVGGRALRRWAASRRTGTGCSTWPATCGSGPPTGGRATTPTTPTSRAAYRSNPRGGARRGATTRPAAVPHPPQGDQRRLAPVRRHLLPSLSTGRAPPADGRHRHEPHRLPVRPSKSHRSATRRGDPMTRPDQILPSWRPGADARRRRLASSTTAVRPGGAAVRLLRQRRHAVVRAPSYVQLDFLIDALKTPRRRGSRRSPSRPEFAALLGGDSAAMAEIGLERIALRAGGAVRGRRPKCSPGMFATSWRRGTHATLHRPLRTVVYQPMLELHRRAPPTRVRRRDRHRRRHRVRAGDQRRSVRSAAGARGRDADQVRVQPRQRRPTVAAENQQHRRKRQRGRHQGDRHPDAARATAHLRRRQLWWRPRDARVGMRRRRPTHVALLVDHDDDGT